MNISQFYTYLFDLYGPQGWWPLINHKGTNPTKSGSVQGYHVGDYSFPRTTDEIFEICVGAILTQNTNWVNVEKALVQLNNLNALNAKEITRLDDDQLKSAIRPAGYFNQKAKKLKLFADFFIALKGEIPTRNQLLDLWGVGPETADSILLYAYKQPQFVVDAYTRRLFLKEGLITEGAKYEDIKHLCESELQGDYQMYQEYHALIVEHAKRTK